MVSIQRESSADVAAIYRVHAAAFPGEDEARLVDRLRAAGEATISLVAELEGLVVGHVLFSPVRVECASPPGVVWPQRGLGMAPLGVLPECQRQGIGTALIQAGLACAREEGWSYVVVLGHPAYYARLGFERASQFGLSNTYGADEAFRVWTTSREVLPPNGGLVRYASAFDVWDV